MKGGYLVVDMHGMDIESGATIDGIYNNIESNYNKPIQIHNITRTGERLNDEYVTRVTMGEPITLQTGARSYKIYPNDTVKVFPFDGGGKSRPCKIVRIPAQIVHNGVTIGDKTSKTSDFNIWAYYFGVEDEIYIPYCPNRQTVLAMYGANDMSATNKFTDNINYDDVTRLPWGGTGNTVELQFSTTKLYYRGVGSASASSAVEIPFLSDYLTLSNDPDGLTCGGDTIFVKKLNTYDYAVGVVSSSEGLKTPSYISATITFQPTETDIKTWVIYEEVGDETYFKNIKNTDIELIEIYTDERPAEGSTGKIKNCSMNAILPRRYGSVRADKTYSMLLTGLFSPAANIVPASINYQFSFRAVKKSDNTNASLIAYKVNENPDTPVLSVADVYKMVNVGVTYTAPSTRLSGGMYFYRTVKDNKIDFKTVTETTDSEVFKDFFGCYVRAYTIIKKFDEVNI